MLCEGNCWHTKGGHSKIYYVYAIYVWPDHGLIIFKASFKSTNNNITEIIAAFFPNKMIF